jgi:hypothetical protein
LCLQQQLETQQSPADELRVVPRGGQIHDELAAHS